MGIQRILFPHIVLFLASTFLDIFSLFSYTSPLRSPAMDTIFINFSSYTKALLPFQVIITHTCRKMIGSLTGGSYWWHFYASDHMSETYTIGWATKRYLRWSYTNHPSLNVRHPTYSWPKYHRLSDTCYLDSTVDVDTSPSPYLLSLRGSWRQQIIPLPQSWIVCHS